MYRCGSLRQPNCEKCTEIVCGGCYPFAALNAPCCADGCGVRSHLASNDIRAIADAAFSSSTKLERVDLDDNTNLKRLPAGLLPGQPTLYAGVCVPGRWCLAS